MNKVRAGNMLNDIIVGDASFVARAAVWVAYYPLMQALAVVLDRFERHIRKQYEPFKREPAPHDWVTAVEIE